MSASTLKPDLYELLLLNKFKSVLKLVIFSYNKIIQDRKKVYRNSEGIDIANGMALENSLTNMLVKEYLQDHNIKEMFNLQLCGFFTEPAEINEDNKTLGFIDIMVTNVSSEFSGRNEENIYYAFECKRINNSNYAKYVDEGILRFIECKYSKDMTFAGMIGYFETNNPDIEDIIKKINTNLNNKFNSGKLVNLSSLKKFSLVDDFEHSYISNHERKDNNSIDLYHLILDYDIIVNVI